MATPDAAPRDLPAVVARVLDDFVAAAREAFADDLVSIVLFGSAAEGALRATWRGPATSASASPASSPSTATGSSSSSATPTATTRWPCAPRGTT